MQQQIGFCTTADGARIAYATVGTGPALIVSYHAPSHLGLEWEEPRVRDFWETMGCHHLVVRYDKLGCGLSDRNRTDFSLDSEVGTIAAIVKALALKSLVLWGQGGQGSAAAIAYAVKFPDRVSHLILCNAQARWHGHTWVGGVDRDIFRALSLSNWRMSSLALAEGVLGSAFDASELQRYLRFRQEAMTPEMAAQMTVAHLYNMDVRDLLPKVSAPTLVAHYRNNRMIPFEAGRELAAGIPGARFVPLEGDAHWFSFNDTRPLQRAIAEFLGDPIEEVGRPASDSPKSSSAAEAAQGVFRKEGEFWTIASWGEVLRLKDVRGLAYIAYLLGHPRAEFHVLSLASTNVGKQGDLAEPVAEEQVMQSDLTVSRMGDAGEMLDAQAKAAYKLTSGEPRNCASSSRKRANLTSLSWSISLRRRLRPLAGSSQGQSGWAVVTGGRHRFPSAPASV
jgi:pimeloyl-ACP methyl ester carboxylesterase